MVGVVTERYIAGGVLVIQQMVDAGSVTKWMLTSGPEYRIARKNSARLVMTTPSAPGLEQHQQQMFERQTAAMDCLTQIRQMRMQTH